MVNAVRCSCGEWSTYIADGRHVCTSCMLATDGIVDLFSIVREAGV